MSFRFPVEAGAIGAFARAIGDLDPRWHDEASAQAQRHGGVSAPPTFVASAAHFDPDWVYRPRPGVPWHGSGRGPGRQAPASGPGGGTSLHAEQHYVYHRPLRPGDVLSVEREPGRSWEKRSGRGGLLRFEEEITSYRDAGGELVLTATRVRVITQRPVDR
jgi:acyl dehydratase